LKGENSTGKVVPDSSCPAGADLTFHGGSVFKGIVNLYHVFIGSSSSDFQNTASNSGSTPQVLKLFSTGINGTAYADILLRYHATNQFNFVDSGFYNTGTTGASLNDNTIATYVNSVIQSKGWPYDTQGVYLVVFRGDFAYSSSKAGGSWSGTLNGGGGWCGFHSKFSVGGKSLVLAPIGDESFVSSNSVQGECAGLYVGYANSNNYQWSGAQPTCTVDSSLDQVCSFGSANNNEFADAIASTWAHELFESVTDSSNGWYRNCDGYEMADLCQQYYGNIQTNGGGGAFNVKFPTSSFLLQEMWLLTNNNHTASQCSLSQSIEVSGGSRFGLTSTWVLLTVVASVALSGHIMF
jgi:hypothetical protein